MCRQAVERDSWSRADTRTQQTPCWQWRQKPGVSVFWRESRQIHERTQQDENGGLGLSSACHLGPAPWPRQVPFLHCPLFPLVHICLAPPLGSSMSFGVRSALCRGARLRLPFVMTIPVLPSSPASVDVPTRKSSLKPILGISWLRSPPLSTELQVLWQSSLGILDNECVSCHVIELSTLERKRCGFVPITKTNKQGLIFITGQGYSTSVF